MDKEEGRNKYSKDFKVPPNFDEVLRGLTREILRNQPEDISKFGEIDSSNEFVPMCNHRLTINLHLFFFVFLSCFFTLSYQLTNILQTSFKQGRLLLTNDSHFFLCKYIL